MRNTTITENLLLTNHMNVSGISVIRNLPVGKTLYDHIAYLPALFTINETIVSSLDSLNPVKFLSWLSTGKGFFSSLGGVEAIAYVKTNISQEIEDYPDIELILVSKYILFNFPIFMEYSY